MRPETKKALQFTPGIAVGMLAAVALGYVLYIGQGILRPLVVALMLVTMSQPLVAWLNKMRVPTWAAVVLLLGGFLRLLVWGAEVVAVEAYDFLTTTEVTLQQPEEPDTADDPGDPGGASIDGAVPIGDGAELVDENSDDPSLAGTGPDDAALADRDTDLDPTAAGSASAPGAAGPDDGTSAGSRSRPGGRTFKGFEKIRIDLIETLRNGGVPDLLTSALDEFLADQQNELVGSLGSGTLFAASVTVNFVQSLFIVIVFMAFLYAEARVFQDKIVAAAGEAGDEARVALADIGRGIQRYLSVKTAASLATGGFCFFALQLLSVPYALLFGFLTFALNYIPTFGSFIAAIFPIVVSFTATHSIVMPIVVAAIYLTANITIGTFIEPRILGQQLNLSPIVVLISVIFWYAMWGVPGAFLAVPMTAAVQITMAHTPSLRPVAILLSHRVPKDKDT